MKLEQSYSQLNIKQINQNNNYQNKNITPRQVNYGSNPNFTGGVDLFLRFLDTNQAWGANAVDLGFMVTPRTVIDFSRGVDAGLETGRREGLGTFNHSMVGAYGTLAGLLFAAGINANYGFTKDDIQARSIFADTETLDMQGKIFDEKLKAAKNNPNANTLKEFVTETLKNYEALSPTENGKWVRFSDEDIAKAADVLDKEFAANSKKISKEGAATLRNTLLSSLGVENNFRIIAPEGAKPHTSRYSLDSIIENVYKLGKVFSKEKVKEAFLNSASVAENEFIKSMKVMNRNRSLAGIGIASAVGISAQPLNMYITKKKTGSDNFVGGGEKDDSTRFKVRKSLVAALFGAGVLATIGNPKHLIKNLQFKGFTPTIKQFKFIYGITIMSRFLSARNDNELRESSIKDTLGFASWLILGNFVQKLVVQGLDKSKTLIKKDGQGVMAWLKNSVLKSRDEVLFAALGDKAFKDGKPLSYAQMLDILPKNSPARKSLKILTAAQLAGYAYSALALGIGIPKLNIFITNKLEAKRKAKESVSIENQPAMKVPTQPLQATNISFNSFLK